MMAIDVYRLKPDAQRELLLEILPALAKYVESNHLDLETIECVLDDLVNSLDSNSDMDQFGTEGWTKALIPNW